MGSGGGGGASKLKRAARRLLLAACGSCYCYSASPTPPTTLPLPLPTITIDEFKHVSPADADADNDNDNDALPKKLCAICLESLVSTRKAIFTAQCSHAFHLSCISSNIRHGSLTCPICRSHWTRLPRNLHPHPCALSHNQTDPVFRILDNSIATLRFHRRSLQRSALYDDDDDDPIVATSYDTTTLRGEFSRLDFSLSLAVGPSKPTMPSTFSFHHHHHNHPPDFGDSPGSSFHLPHSIYNVRTPAYLSVKLSPRHALDLVLVASANGRHLRLVKQAMALVIFSLRPIDRLAIVTSCSSTARAFPLRRMTTAGKRAALQVVDGLFHMEQANPAEGLKKGIKILEDRAHKNLESLILHLLDCPGRTVSFGYSVVGRTNPIPVHRFHLGFGFGNGVSSNRFIMQEFEELVASLVGGVIRDVQVRIEEESRVVRLGELRKDEERRILVDLGGRESVGVGYSYKEGGGDAATTTTSGERVVSLQGHNNKAAAAAASVSDDEEGDAGNAMTTTSTSTSGDAWGFRDPYMAMRWAKHLHGYRL